jgi:hypothetical protein
MGPVGEGLQVHKISILPPALCSLALLVCSSYLACLDVTSSGLNARPPSDIGPG